MSLYSKFNRTLCAVAALLALSAPAAASSPQESVGLVLSGGGAKGIAHIGVIQALEDNDIPIDYVTGTSMGAIVGSLYAMGYTPSEMLDLILSKGFSYRSTGTVDPRLTYYFSRPEQTPAMYTLGFGGSGAGDSRSVPQSLISPVPMNFAFMEIFARYTAQCGGDFNRLFVPFRCVSSNITRKHKQVFGHGDLADCVRASMSFPIVFQPVEMDSCQFYDGGIYDNFPTDVMRTEFAPAVMLGIDVSSSSKGPQTSIIDQLDKLIMQTQSYAIPESEGIRLRIHLDEFGLLDFPAARAIYDKGYQAAMQVMDTIKARVTPRVSKTTRRIRRDVFKAATPYLRFGTVSVTGGTRGQNNYIDYLFRAARPAHSDTMSLEEARSAFYSALSPGRLRDLGVHTSYNDSTGLFDLSLKATVKDRLHAGVGGYITSSANSYIYLNTGYSTMGLSSVSASLGGWIGQSYMAGQFDARMTLGTRVPSAIGLQGVVSRHKYYDNDYLFFEDKIPSFILDNQYFVKLRYSLAAGRSGTVDIGGGYGHLYQSFFDTAPVPGPTSGRDNCRQDLGQVFASYLSNSLNHINYPTDGAFYSVTAMGVSGMYSHRPWTGDYDRHQQKWLQLEGRTRNYLQLSRHWSLGIESDVMLSTRKLLRSYNASLINAPVYAPTPSANNRFMPRLRANSFIAAGLVPVYRYNDNLTARASLHCFMPLRSIVADPATGEAAHGRWMANPRFFGEVNVAYTLPFGSISGYCNYTDGPGHKWSGGISFGIFLLAPEFLR